MRLGLELIRRWRGLNKEFPGFAAATALLSCEEAVVDVREYVSRGDCPASGAAEKEHVMVGVQIRLDGRAALLLADPGYHVPRVITVMADRAYPHTGWFTQVDEPECRKEYNYVISPQNNGYVEWQERVTRPGDDVKLQTSLVFAAKPYRDGVDVTERRNLVYNFKSLLSRDQKGHLLAGLYFPVGAWCKDAQFTLFFDNGSEKRKSKYKFCTFLEAENIPESISEEIELCNAQLNYDDGELRKVICKLARVMSNEAFIGQMLEINDEICRICL